MVIERLSFLSALEVVPFSSGSIFSAEPSAVFCPGSLQLVFFGFGGFQHCHFIFCFQVHN
jgi:hypothetical protein